MRNLVKGRGVSQKVQFIRIETFKILLDSKLPFKFLKYFLNIFVDFLFFSPKCID